MSDQEIITAFDKLPCLNDSNDSVVIARELPGNQKKCPQCGVVLVLSDLCPNCLLKHGLKGSSAGGIEPFGLPSIESLAEVMRGVEPIEFIGRGGMAAVYKARRSNQIVAVKVMVPQAADSISVYHRFTREARALGRLNHRNVVRIYEFEPAGNFPYFAMDFVDGSSLRQKLESGPLDLCDAVPLFLQLCDGLEHVHENDIIHRDIKPGNLLVDKGGRLKIADFGLAKLIGGAGASDEWETVDGGVMGTWPYMAPEQLENPRAVDHRADIYSAAVVFYRMLTGGLPLGRFPAPSEKTKVDPSLDEVLFRALEKDVALRYQDIGEFKQAVEAVVFNEIEPGQWIGRLDLERRSQRLAKALRENPGNVHLWEQLKQICDQLNDQEGSIWASSRLFGIYRRQGRLEAAILVGQKLMLRLPKDSTMFCEIKHQILSDLEEWAWEQFKEAA
jgi:serine/threonine protein kinase